MEFKGAVNGEKCLLGKRVISERALQRESGRILPSPYSRLPALPIGVHEPGDDGCWTHGSMNKHRKPGG